MRSPSGGEARRRGGTQVGKTPPSPEMSISGLTESGLSGRIMSPNLIDPGFAGRCGPPLRRAVSFLGSRLLANHHWVFGTLAAAPSSGAPEWPPIPPPGCGLVPADAFKPRLV